MLAAMDGDLTEDAVRWLRRSYRAGALVDALAAVGMAVPALYGPRCGSIASSAATGRSLATHCGPVPR